MKLRVWAEYISPSEACKDSIVNLLKEYNVNLCISLPYNNLSKELSDFLILYNKENIEITLWPLLEDKLGYWPSEKNADQFISYIKELIDWSNQERVKFQNIAVDLELPYTQVQKINNSPALKKLTSILNIYKENKNKKIFIQSSEKYRHLLKMLHKNNIKTITAAIAEISEDIVLDEEKLQDILETPVTTVNWDLLSFMMYNSMLVGYSKGMISQKDAVWLLYSRCKDLNKKLGSRAGLSVGVTYIGKLGNEPYYKSPNEMKPDISAAKAAGISDIAIYNLEGVLKYKHPSEWFKMVLTEKAKIPQFSLKAEILRSLLQNSIKLLL